MEHSNQLNRAFIEAMFKLRKDITNLHNNINTKNLVLKLGKTTISFNSNNPHFWIINSPKLKTDFWNPTVFEMIIFLKNYNDEEINFCINHYHEKENKIKSKVNAIPLMQKFISILSLLKSKTKELNKEQYFEFEIFKNNIKIWYCLNDGEFYFKFDDNEKDILRTETIKEILELNKYNYISDVLEKYYYQFKYEN